MDRPLPPSRLAVTRSMISHSKSRLNGFWASLWLVLRVLIAPRPQCLFTSDWRKHSPVSPVMRIMASSTLR